jgi:hypothetical protein
MTSFCTFLILITGGKNCTGMMATHTPLRPDISLIYKLNTVQL